MRRISSLPRLCLWLAVVTTTVAGPSLSHAQVQPTATPPRVAALPANPLPQATAPQIDPLLAQIDQAIEITSKRYLTVNVHSPWQIFHGILALKQDFRLNLDASGKEKVNALQWIATSEPQFDRQPLLMKTVHGGKFHPFTRPWAFEGHPSQFLALMSQSDLPVEYAFKVGNDQITIADMIQNTMKEVNSKEEVTWVLWALQHYLKPSASWVNQHGEAWSIEKLVQIETSLPVVGAACGGNHRLFALTRTRDKHLKQGGTLTGVWAQSDLKIRQHVELARQLQNSDGSFSSKFYQAPDVTNDVNQRFNTTGHTMEFLSIGLPANRLNEQWVRNATSVLSRELIQHRQRQIDCGPLYHTLNSLIIYRERVKALLPPAVAAKPVETAMGELPVLPGPSPAATPVATPIAKEATATPLKKRLEFSSTPTSLPTLEAIEIPKPVEVTPPTGTAVEAKPTTATAVEGPALAPSTSAADVQAGTVKRPTPLPSISNLKSIDPGRVVTSPPSASSSKDSRPGLLPSDVATPIELLDLLDLSDLSEADPAEPDLLDTVDGPLKPTFRSAPPASRTAPAKPITKTISSQTVAPLTELIEDSTLIEEEAVSAEEPVNR